MDTEVSVSTPEKKIRPPFRQGFEPATLQSRVRRSNHLAISAPLILLRFCVSWNSWSVPKSHICFSIVPVKLPLF